MKKTLTLLIAFTLFTLQIPLWAQQISDLEKSVRDLQRENGFQHSSISVCVYNVTKGKPVYSYNSQLSLSPASVNKLFTTGVGFARLGSDFRFTTKIALRGTIDREGVLHGNIYLTGGGDPLLGSYRYRPTRFSTVGRVHSKRRVCAVLMDAFASIPIFLMTSRCTIRGNGGMWGTIMERV